MDEHGVFANWQPLEEDLTSRPHAENRPCYHDQAIIDFVKDRIPLREPPHSDFTVNVSARPVALTQSFLEQQLAI